MPRFTASFRSLPLALALAGSAMLSSAAHAAPGRPAGLQALPVGENEIILQWEDTADNETGFQVWGSPNGGTFQNIGTIGPNNQQALVTGLSAGVLYDFHVRAIAPPGPASGYSNTASAYTDQGVAPTVVCSAGPGEVCLDNRFRVSAEWRTSLGVGDGTPQQLTNLSAAFSFFNPDNLEVLLKVLDGCAINEHFWVFFSATTNVEFSVAVTDTQNGVLRRYFNPLDHPATPVQDTSAFATCP